MLQPKRKSLKELALEKAKENQEKIANTITVSDNTQSTQPYQPASLNKYIKRENELKTADPYKYFADVENTEERDRLIAEAEMATNIGTPYTAQDNWGDAPLLESHPETWLLGGKGALQLAKPLLANKAINTGLNALGMYDLTTNTAPAILENWYDYHAATTGEEKKAARNKGMALTAQALLDLTPAAVADKMKAMGKWSTKVPKTKVSPWDANTYKAKSGYGFSNYDEFDEFDDLGGTSGWSEFDEFERQTLKDFLSKEDKYTKPTKYISKEKDVSTSDLEGLINKQLKEGLGIKKLPGSLKVKVEKVDYDESVQNLLQDEFKVKLKYKGKDLGYVGLGRTENIDTGIRGESLLKLEDFPYQYSHKFDAGFKGSGISGELNKAITNSLQELGLGKLRSSIGSHTDEGLARWQNLVQKGYAAELPNKYGLQFMLHKNGGAMVPNIPTWNYPSKGTPIYRDTTEIPSNSFAKGGFMSEGNTPPDMNPETLKQYNQELIQRENPNKKGFDSETQLWKPHTSAEGGTPTIGYGTKLTQPEYESGKIKLNNKEVDWIKGLTEEEVQMLKNQDIQYAQSKAKAYIDNTYGSGTFNKMPQTSQMLATDYTYNLGNLNTYPKFTEALVNNDIDGMKKEYSRSWTDTSGNKQPLKYRNAWTLKKIELIEKLGNENSNKEEVSDERAQMVDKDDPNYDVLVNKRGGLNKLMLDFYNELDDLYLNETGKDLRITSGARYASQKIGKAHGHSHHEARDGGAFAMDIGREHGDVYSWLLNTEEGLKLMDKYDLGIIDETDPEIMKKTGADASHFHIGRDSKFKAQVKERLRILQNDPSSLPKLTAYINKNSKYKEASEKLTTEQKQIVEQLPVKAKKNLLDKIYQEKLNSKVALDNELKIQVKNYNVHLDKLPKSFATGPSKNVRFNPGFKFNNGGNIFDNGGTTETCGPGDDSCEPTDRLQAYYDAQERAALQRGVGAVNVLKHLEEFYQGNAQDYWKQKGIKTVAQLSGQDWAPACIGSACGAYSASDPNFKRDSSHISNYRVKRAIDRGQFEEKFPGLKLEELGRGDDAQEKIFSKYYPSGTIFSFVRDDENTGHAVMKTPEGEYIQSHGDEGFINTDTAAKTKSYYGTDEPNASFRALIPKADIDQDYVEALEAQARDWDRKPILQTKKPTTIQAQEGMNYLDYLNLLNN